jgi:hypothetical protein
MPSLLCSKCGERPRNKWTSYCNECYNAKRRERANTVEAKQLLEQGATSADIPTQILQAAVDTLQGDIGALRQALEETRRLSLRLCGHLEEYRPDLAEFYKQKLGL